MPLSCKLLTAIASILACICSTMQLRGAAALALAIVLVPAVVATGSAQAQTVRVLDRFMGLRD
jgi:hypothetical protein